MTTLHFVLIDYENTQPHDLNRLKQGQYKIKLFVGPQQKSLPVAFVEAIRSVDANFECIVMQIPGKNALDFHIAYALGHWSCKHPNATFTIVSKDKGFDPLVQTLNTRAIKTRRVDKIAALCQAQGCNRITDHSPFDIACACLKKMKHTPTRKKALLNVLKSGKNKDLSEDELELIHTRLCQQGIVTYNGIKPILMQPTSGFAT